MVSVSALLANYKLFLRVIETVCHDTIFQRFLNAK